MHQSKVHLLHLLLEGHGDHRDAAATEIIHMGAVMGNTEGVGTSYKKIYSASPRMTSRRDPLRTPKGDPSQWWPTQVHEGGFPSAPTTEAGDIGRGKRAQCENHTKVMVISRTAEVS